MAASNMTRKTPTPPGESSVDEVPGSASPSNRTDGHGYLLLPDVPVNEKATYSERRTVAHESSESDILDPELGICHVDEISIRRKMEHQVNITRAATTTVGKEEIDETKGPALPTTSATARSPSLIELPPELTSTIIKHVLFRSLERHSRFNSPPLYSATPAVCQVNRRLRRESLALHFGLPQFMGNF